MLKLSDIITGADTLVPNSYTPADKVPWLNAINQDFFSIVKIPKVANFTTIANNGTYSLPSDARAKSIDKVQVGMTKYKSLHSEDVQPGQNHYTFDDETGKITLQPAPFQKEVVGLARYYRIATTTFLAGTIATAVPDAPPEYHWIYTIGLCARIAKAQDDLGKAANYESDYRDALNVAASNYPKEA